MSFDALQKKFFRRFGRPPLLLMRAPGRINLIGEHTDYNEGFVLPAAIDRAFMFALAPRHDRRLGFMALDYDASYEGSLDKLVRSAEGWPNFLLGACAELHREGRAIQGFDLAFGGDIPVGAGLSSSAALESGLLLGLNEVFDLGLDRPQLATLAQGVENHFVGVQCGIMDMYAVLMGRQDHALLLDCRSLAHRPVEVKLADCVFILCNSGVEHELVHTAYNDRRADCEQGVALLRTQHPGIRSLRDVTSGMLEKNKHLLPERVYRRCRFVLSENERVHAAVDALESGRLQDFGKLLYASHRGLRDDYEVSCPELDFLVDQASSHPAVLGARMMGGGFGGCTLNLVKRAAFDDFSNTMRAQYMAQFQRDLPVWAVSPADGARTFPPTQTDPHTIPTQNNPS